MENSEVTPEKITTKDFDKAYDALSHFLFEQYKKKKAIEATETQTKEPPQEN